MTDTQPNKFIDAIPTLRSKWWTGLLVLSLMGNLLVLGSAGGHMMGDRQFGGPGKQNMVQIIPRKFFDELSKPRRRELMDVLRGSRDDFKSMREQTAAAALELATALEMPTYDGAAVKIVIDKISTGRESLSGKASAVVLTIIEKLTPEERANLASAIRDRASHERQ